MQMVRVQNPTNGQAFRTSKEELLDVLSTGPQHLLASRRPTGGG